jgi:hypothetical protein
VDPVPEPILLRKYVCIYLHDKPFLARAQKEVAKNATLSFALPVRLV